MMQTACRAIVNNTPSNIRRYVVVQIADQKLWYWMSFDSLKEAKASASEIDGAVIESMES